MWCLGVVWRAVVGRGKSAREVWCGVRRGVWRAVVRGIVEPAWGYGVRREFVGCGKSAREACSMA